MNRQKMSIALLMVLITAFGFVTPPALAAEAQVATLTITAGDVALVHADGSAEQPAPDGALVGVGDEVRTLWGSRATLTFPAGAEVELGELTSVRIEQLLTAGDHVVVSLSQGSGVSVHRVKPLDGAASLYRVEVGGAVVRSRGAELALYGPSDENLVSLVCSSVCDEKTTFVDTPVAAETGYVVEVEDGAVVSDVTSFRPNLEFGQWDAVVQGASEAAQDRQDDDGNGGSDTADGRAEHNSRNGGDHQHDDRSNDSGPMPASPVARPGTPIASPSASTGGSSPVVPLVVVLGSLSFGSTEVLRRVQRWSRR